MSIEEEMRLELQLKSDRDIYGMSYERLINGKRERLDPTTIKCVTLKKGAIEPLPPPDRVIQFGLTPNTPPPSLIDTEG